jgi:hypothetical protein
VTAEVCTGDGKNEAQAADVKSETAISLQSLCGFNLLGVLFINLRMLCLFACGTSITFEQLGHTGYCHLGI